MGPSLRRSFGQQPLGTFRDHAAPGTQIFRGLAYGRIEERLQVTLGQRYYFSDQRVTLPGVAPRSSNATDLLAAVSGQITRDWRADAAWQFDTQNGTTVRQNLGASYRPAPGRVLNLGYRFIDQSTEQVDVSAQWPLGARWYGMFRYNYSFQDDKLVEGLAGVEYNAGCWAFRAVVHSLATSATDRSNAIFFQLELNGVSSIGSNPLDVLRRNIYGYTKTNDIPYENDTPYLP